MIQQMINNLLGKYSEVVLTQKEAMNFMGLVTQPKQYAIGDRVVQESDPEFDINKWIKLALVIIKK